MSSSATVAEVETIERRELVSESFAEGGEFLPLSAWRTKGLRAKTFSITPRPRYSGCVNIRDRSAKTSPAHGMQICVRRDGLGGSPRATETVVVDKVLARRIRREED